MKRIVLCLVVFVFSVVFYSTAFAKERGWRKDDSEKYLAWWDRKYQGSDSAVIGAVLYQKEDYQTAVNELEKAVKLGTADGRVYYQLGYSYQQLGHTDKAMEMYQKAIKLLDEKDPNHRYDYYAKYNLALLYKDKNNNDDAIAMLKYAITKNPDEPGAHNLLAWLYWKKGDADGSLKEYAESIKIDPNQEDAQYNAGVLYFNKGDAEQAKECFGKVIKINPAHEKASYYLAHMGDKELLAKGGYTNLSIPQPALRHCYLGKKYLDEKKYEDAALEYETAIEIDPKVVEAQQGLGVVYEYNDKGVRYGQGFKIDKSIFHYEKALALNPKLEEAVFNVGVLYSMKNRTDEAVRYYLRLIREMPDNAKAHYNLAVLYDNKLKNNERAIHHYSKYLTLDPQSPKKAEIESRIRKLRVR